MVINIDSISHAVCYRCNQVKLVTHLPMVSICYDCYLGSKGVIPSKEIPNPRREHLPTNESKGNVSQEPKSKSALQSAIMNFQSAKRK